MKTGILSIFILAFSALLLACIATGINYWYQIKLPGDTKHFFGLWRTCAKSSLTGTVCVTWGDLGAYTNAHWLQGCQGTMLLAILLYFIGIVAILLHVTILVHSRALVKLAGFFFLLGGICNCIAFVLFAAKYKSLLKITTGGLYAGFGLAVVSGVAGLLSGIVAVCLKQGSYESF